MADSISPVRFEIGANGLYQWLATECELDVLLQRCPVAVLGKYLAVTSIDSGSLAPDEALKSAGWESRNRIAYSPNIRSIETLPRAGYDEWYVFENPRDLGKVSDENPFEIPPKPGQVQVFVNYGGFALNNAALEALTNLFWKQLDWIYPESYLADGSDYLTFVSRNKDIFNVVCHTLSAPSAK
jgi:hypothetical protein